MKRMIGATLLVAGTAIGAGMLALPVATAQGGFLASAAVFIGVWFVTLISAFLVLEACLWLPGEVNLVSLSRATLGRACAAVVWVLFLLLLYSLTAAYLSGSGSIINSALHGLFGITLPHEVQVLIPLILLSPFVVLGTSTVDLFNRILMIGLIGTYLVLVGAATPRVDQLSAGHFAPLFGALPVIVTSFGFHVVIPSLTSYLKHDRRKLQWAIFWGSLLALFVYLAWEAIVFGVVPIEGLLDVQARGVPVTDALAALTGKPWIQTSAILFSFFAIVTSFLGLSLSLFSFLRDGTQHRFGKIRIALLTFLPPLLFAQLFPKGFILALEYAGVIVALISGILPAFMVWKGRRHFSGWRLGGGKLVLIALILLSFVVAISDLLK